MSPKTSQPMSIEFGLLGYLRLGPLHGYEIHQHLMEPDGPGMVWRLKQAQLYALLGKLEESGFLQSTLQAQETRPIRRVYRLTKEGQDTYLRWLTTPITTPHKVRQEFMVKLYFAQRENPQTVRILIDNQLSEGQVWLEIHQRQLETAQIGAFTSSVHQYRLGQIQAILTWLERLKLESSNNVLVA